MTDDESLIRQQIEYYQARASEYDEWFLRIGRYDRGEENRRQWFAETAALRDALAVSQPHGKILELACGTGIWTALLAPHAEKLLAIDASPEAISINRERVADDRVDYLCADLFTWRPTERFDFVFFSFWLSHIPPARFDDFWKTIHDATHPGGGVFFVDSLPVQESTAQDHEPLDRDGRAVRKLNDGRQFEIVKIYYDPPKLEQRLNNMGWDGYIRTTGRFFLYGCLTRQ